jgi:hypothetical protein
MCGTRLAFVGVGKHGLYNQESSTVPIPSDLSSSIREY